MWAGGRAWAGPPPTFEEVKPGILRKIERIRRGATARELLDPQLQAADAREWQRRRRD